MSKLLASLRRELVMSTKEEAIAAARRHFADDFN
jgi:hypothetical protein